MLCYHAIKPIRVNNLSLGEIKPSLVRLNVEIALERHFINIGADYSKVASGCPIVAYRVELFYFKSAQFGYSIKPSVFSNPSPT